MAAVHVYMFEPESTTGGRREWEVVAVDVTGRGHTHPHPSPNKLPQIVKDTVKQSLNAPTVSILSGAGMSVSQHSGWQVLRTCVHNLNRAGEATGKTVALHPAATNKRIRDERTKVKKTQLPHGSDLFALSRMRDEIVDQIDDADRPATSAHPSRAKVTVKVRREPLPPRTDSQAGCGFTNADAQHSEGLGALPWPRRRRHIDCARSGHQTLC
jgi:hypothetical protein